jgi:hypothetical protein
MGTTDDHDLLIAMNVKLDVLLTGQTDHENRIRGLERWRWLLTGGAALAGTGGGALLAKLVGV